MTGVGILEGDTVLIQRADVAQHGDIVVALLTNKKLR